MERTLENYAVSRIEKLENENQQLEALCHETNSENIRLREMLAAIGDKMSLSPSKEAIWMDSIFESDSMFNRITKYFQLMEKWEAKNNVEENSD